MSARKVITDHCLIRWLERIEGLDIKAYRDAAGRAGYDGECDGDVIEFLEAYTDVPVATIRKALMEVVVPALGLRAQTVKYKGVTIRLGDGAATTCFQSRAKRAPSAHGRRPEA